MREVANSVGGSYYKFEHVSELPRPAARDD